MDEAKRTHRHQTTEARTTAAELALLYPALDDAARELMESTNIKALVLRSDEEVHSYEAARTELMTRVTSIANRGAQGDENRSKSS